MSRFKAGTATYPGDVTDMVGEVKGPTTFGTFIVATAAEFDAARGVTRVSFSTTTDEDRAVGFFDEHGNMRLPEGSL